MRTLWFLLLTAAVLVPLSGRAEEAAELARKIDSHLETAWKTAGVVPAPEAEDAEFMRRVYLDIGGKIPPVAEVRQFLADDRPDKRRRLVERLLEGPNYITHFANVWRTVL